LAWLFHTVTDTERMFIAFIECKISGTWERTFVTVGNEDFPTYRAMHQTNCEVHIIEPDGLRRIFHFNNGSHISVENNILTYQPDQADEITVDEKEQAGKGKTRSIL